MPEAPKKEVPSPDKSLQNIQDNFLNNARKERAMVTIFLMGGAKLTGKIKSFDKFSVVLESNHQEQLIFKHAIATVQMFRSGPPPQPAAPAAEA